MKKSARQIYDELNCPTVVVIGGGFAGLNLIHRLNDAPFKVLLLDRNNFHTFQPLLYQVATGSLTPDSIAYPFRRSVAPMKNIAFRMCEVTGVNPARREVYTDKDTIEYDYLVIATGAGTNFFGNQVIERLAMQLKTISQALDIRSDFLQEFETAIYLKNNEEQARKYLNFVVVGAGPTGVEVSGALAEIKNAVLRREYRELDPELMQIWLIDGNDRVLSNFSEKSSRAALNYLEKMGVQVKLNTRVTDYDGERIAFGDGTHMLTNTVIWSAGVKGATIPGIPPESLALGNRYRVDEFNRVSGLERVFALGDVACMQTEKYPQGHPMVAQPAIQQGKLLAENLRSLENGRKMKPFRYFYKGDMATIGRHKAVVDIGKFHLHGVLAWYMWMVVHVWFLVGFRNRSAVVWSWFWKYLSWRNTIRLIVRPYQRPNVVSSTPTSTAG